MPRRDEMSTAPLTRDQQIELMVNAAERHAAHAARWIADDQVKQVVRSREGEQPTSVYEQETRMLARCA